MKRAIIYDLDHTLFDPKTLDKSIFQPAFELLKTIPLTSNSNYAQLESDFFSISLNAFIKRHINGEQQNEFIQSLRALNNIPPLNTYSDGHVVEQINTTNYLVTSGLREFQNLKIDALGIRDWFAEIYIDDPVTPEWAGKEEIIELILSKHNYKPSELLVVGDNPESEIKAGNNIGIDTVQVLRDGIVASKAANYRIKSLGELHNIIHQEV